MSDKPQFQNPDTVHPPLGPYSHTATVPPGTELISISGQIGIRPDGSIGPTIAEQADQAFENVVALLRAHGLGPEDVIKLSVFIAAGQDGEAVRASRLKHFGAHHPTSTTVYVSQLVRPEWLIEVEALAARQ